MTSDKPPAALLEKVAPTLLPEVKVYLERHRAELARMLAAPGQGGVQLARRNAKIMDGLLTALFPAAYAAMRSKKRWSPVLLGAVGGYGRCVVGLKSDLDVRIVTVGDPARAQPIAEALLYPLWDAGVAIGHQVITVDDTIELARTDLPTATSLLDFRPLTGDEQAAEALRDRARAGLFSDAQLGSFIQRLEAEVADRHPRFGGSVYLLEPEVKSGPGGLRDLDIAFWAARARWQVAEIDDLVRLGVLVSREAEEITAAREFVWTLRNHLHAHAGRRSDRLAYDEQSSIARSMGYTPADASPEADGPYVERFMSDYYRHARAITRARERILARAMPRIGRRKPHEQDLGAGLRSFDGQVTFADAAHVASEPAIALRLYATAVARDLPVLPFAREAVARAVGDPGFCAALRASAEAASHFLELACTARLTRFRGGSVLAELHDVGLLTAMIPEFSPVVGRVHHDTYHVYTVDVHSVAAVDRLRALARGDLADEYTLACRLAGDAGRPRVAYLATLLHDVGKAIGGKDHAARGAEMAGDILARLGVSGEDADECCHLIRQHLLMYHVATRRDLDDPVTVSAFATEVHGREGLRDLYLLTVADLSTTSPTSMTSWKARMLDELYLATDARLSGEGASREERAEKVRAAARERWAGTPAGAEVDAFVASMPERYLLANGPDVIEAHAEVARRAEVDGFAVAVVPSRHPEAAEICVAARDRAGLLAAITAAIAASRLEVHKAQIFSRTLPDGHGQAVDLFWVRDRVEGVDAVARALPRLVRDLGAALRGEVEPRDLATDRGSSPWRERPSPPVVTEVRVDDRSQQHTVLEVLTRDRTGVLFTLADTLHDLGLSIATAKINTEGTRVADVFYVSERDGSKLAPGARTDEVRAKLIEAIAVLAKRG